MTSHNSNGRTQRVLTLAHHEYRAAACAITAILRSPRA